MRDTRSLFDPPSRGRFGDNEEEIRSNDSVRSDLHDLEVVLHYGTPKAVLVSLDGKESKAQWLPRSLIEIDVDNKKRQEAEALFDSYLHAIGMAEDLPLFRAVGLMGVDVTVAEQVVEALSQLVPVAGEIVVKVGAARIRLYRDKDGNPHAEEAKEGTIIPPLDPRYGYSGKDEVESTYPPSGKARGLSRDTIRAIVERAEASAAAARTEAAP